MTTQTKRERQREGRLARLEAERRAARRAARRRRLITGGIVGVIVVALLFLVSVVGGDDDGEDTAADQTTSSTEAPVATVPPAGPKPEITVPEGAPPTELQTEDLIVGEGPEAKQGDSLQVLYVGVAYSTKQEFDSNWDGEDPGEAFTFELGAGGVIPGWDEGLRGMRVGGRRQLTIPPDLAYGPEGQPPDIGPNDTLIFVVDLVGVSGG